MESRSSSFSGPALAETNVKFLYYTIILTMLQSHHNFVFLNSTSTRSSTHCLFFSVHSILLAIRVNAWTCSRKQGHFGQICNNRSHISAESNRQSKYPSTYFYQATRAACSVKVTWFIRQSKQHRGFQTYLLRVITEAMNQSQELDFQGNLLSARKLTF